jgi:hypothetical protein
LCAAVGFILTDPILDQDSSSKKSKKSLLKTNLITGTNELIPYLVPTCNNIEDSDKIVLFKKSKFKILLLSEKPEFGY